MLSKSMKDKRGPATGLRVKVITYIGISREKATSKRPNNCAKGSGKGTSAIFKQLLNPSLDRKRPKNHEKPTKIIMKCLESLEDGVEIASNAEEHAVAELLVHAGLDRGSDVDVLHDIREVPDDPIHHAYRRNRSHQVA